MQQPAAAPPATAPGSSAASAPSAASLSGPGGRGAGPDHREARLAEGMAAMINALRPLPLVARTWDLAAFKAHGMRPAPRPAGSGAVGRDVALMINHFPLQLRASHAFEHEVHAARAAPAATAPAAAALEAAGSQPDEPKGKGEEAALPGEPQGQEAAGQLQSQEAAEQLPGRLVEQLVALVAASQGWPSGWVCDGGAGRVYAAQQVVVAQGGEGEGAGEAAGAAAQEAKLLVVVELSEEVAEQPGWSGAYEVGGCRSCVCVPSIMSFAMCDLASGYFCFVWFIACLPHRNIMHACVSMLLRGQRVCSCVCVGLAACTYACACAAVMRVRFNA